jgi:endoglucanase
MVRFPAHANLTRRRLLATAAVGLAALVLPLAPPGPAQAAGGVGTGYWHTSGNQILDAAGNRVRIAGINWYGFETANEVAHGLWSVDYRSMLDTIKGLGYNSVRLPFSNQMIRDNRVPSAIAFRNSDGPINQDLQGLTSLQIMDKIVEYAGTAGLKIILDNHRSAAGNSAEQNGLWYTADYPQQTWIGDWVMLANRYLGNPTVVGVDLRNEPHNPSNQPYGTGAVWGTGNPANDWRLAAEAAGNAVLAANPALLVIVEGVSDYRRPDGVIVSDWWGGNLQGAADFPVRLNVANRLVNSAHDYGPNLFRQSWFNTATTYQSLVQVWRANWGYLHDTGVAPVWVGEFGTGNRTQDVSDTKPGSQGQWFTSLVRYLSENPELGWSYWALNGEDPYGLLGKQDGSTPASPAKQQLLQTIEFTLSP